MKTLLGTSGDSAVLLYSKYLGLGTLLRFLRHNWFFRLGGNYSPYRRKFRAFYRPFRLFYRRDLFAKLSLSRGIGEAHDTGRIGGDPTGLPKAQEPARDLLVVRGVINIPHCPSSGNLRLIRRFAKGGSGSSGVRV